MADAADAEIRNKGASHAILTASRNSEWTGENRRDEAKGNSAIIINPQETAILLCAETISDGQNTARWTTTQNG